MIDEEDYPTCPTCHDYIIACTCYENWLYKNMKDKIHNLLNEIVMARIEATVTNNLELKMVIAATILEHIEEVLKELENQL